MTKIPQIDFKMLFRKTQKRYCPEENIQVPSGARKYECKYVECPNSNIPQARYRYRKTPEIM